jgi:hypothetical protein
MRAIVDCGLQALNIEDVHHYLVAAECGPITSREPSLP